MPQNGPKTAKREGHTIWEPKFQTRVMHAESPKAFGPPKSGHPLAKQGGEVIMARPSTESAKKRLQTFFDLILGQGISRMWQEGNLTAKILGWRKNVLFMGRFRDMCQHTQKNGKMVK